MSCFTHILAFKVIEVTGAIGFQVETKLNIWYLCFLLQRTTFTSFRCAFLLLFLNYSYRYMSNGYSNYRFSLGLYRRLTLLKSFISTSMEESLKSRKCISIQDLFVSNKVNKYWNTAIKENDGHIYHANFWEWRFLLKEFFGWKTFREFPSFQVHIKSNTCSMYFWYATGLPRLLESPPFFSLSSILLDSPFFFLKNTKVSSNLLGVFLTVTTIF